MDLDASQVLDGHRVEVVVATSKQGRTERFYFDAETFLPRQLDLWEEGPEADRAGQFYLAHYILEDYREVRGMQVPFSIRRVRPNSLAHYRFTDVRHNAPVADDLFNRRRPTL